MNDVALDPCGQVVAYLPHCYTSPCRFFHDSDRVDEIEWYWAPEGAARLPHYTIFHTSILMHSNFGTDHWQYPGELPGPRKHADGVNKWGYTGKAGCQVGTVAQFAQGLSIKDAKPVVRPECCCKPARVDCMGSVIEGYIHYVGYGLWEDVGGWVDVPFKLYLDPVTGVWSGSVHADIYDLTFAVRWWHDAPLEDLTYTGHLELTVTGACERSGTLAAHHTDCGTPEPFSHGYYPFFLGDLYGCGTHKPFPDDYWAVWIKAAPPPSFVASGGLKLRWPPPFLAVASGTVRLSGTALMDWPNGATASGTLRLSGSATVGLTATYTASGTLVLAGACLLSPEFVQSASGTLRLSGTCPVTLTVLVEAGGGLELAGLVLAELAFAVQAQGGLVLAGLALADLDTGPVADGCLTQSGELVLTQSGDYLTF